MAPRDEDSIGWELGGILLAFAQRPRNWLVLARNFVPVVGVFALGWDGLVMLCFYWIDAVCLLALLLAAVFIRGMAMLRRTRGYAIPTLVFQGLIAFGLFFFLFGIPYWMVYFEILMEPLWDVSGSRVLTAAALFVVLANVVGAFLRGGYFGMTLEEFRQLGAPELELLALRGVALVVLTAWTRGVLLAPLFAVVAAAFETWPQVKRDWQRMDETPVG